MSKKETEIEKYARMKKIKRQALDKKELEQEYFEVEDIFVNKKKIIKNNPSKRNKHFSLDFEDEKEYESYL